MFTTFTMRLSFRISSGILKLVAFVGENLTTDEHG